MFSNLTPAWANLVRTMQRVNFGRIENLELQDGQPGTTPASRVVRTIKLGGAAGPRPEADRQDYRLPAEVRDLVQHCRDAGTGWIRGIDIQHGLPIKMTLEEPA